MERLKELIDRMVAPGPAFAQLSTSEGHEIREGCLDLIARVTELEREAEAWRDHFSHLHFVPDQNEPGRGYIVRND